MTGQFSLYIRSSPAGRTFFFEVNKFDIIKKMKSKKKKKALVLFSGGLDSILVVEVLRRQEVEVHLVSFTSYFFSAEEAKESARRLGLSLEVVDISEKHLETVKNPRFGRGSGVNPCIDCHLLMLKKAKEMMDKEGFDFVATGEVLGERPMSQNKKAMELIKKESGLNGFLLRPLSARHLEPTIPEEKGWVERKELFSIKGRSRKKQIELAKRWGIKKYPHPAGGCILCEKEFAQRFKKLTERSEPEKNDVLLLKVGRHFWCGDFKIVVGRDHEENLEIKKLAGREDLLVELEAKPGPTTLVSSFDGKIAKDALRKAKKLTKKYANEEGDITFNVFKP